MNLTNQNYLILMGTKNFTEGYYRDKKGWLKVSARGRKFRMTAEQVLNHLLPALAGVKPGLRVKVQHHDDVSEVHRRKRSKQEGRTTKKTPNRRKLSGLSWTQASAQRPTSKAEEFGHRETTGRGRNEA